ncbi:tumor necrosis factor ligand superfamily member 6 [Paroedura picta]|uniref:tumor necrosis factor ligand superfamily member 6 n=1 Tax=Paroedura picta TaxID=143630 RepID=UPI004056A8A5
MMAGRSSLASERWVEVLRFSAVNQKRFIAVGAGAAWGTQRQERNASPRRPEAVSRDSCDRSSSGFPPAMQQNPPPYPEVFWTNSSAVLSPNCIPLGLYPTGAGPRPHQDPHLPWPVPKRKRKDGTCLCFLMVFLLVFLALTGVGLAMFQIFRLQKELELSRNGHLPQPPEMLRGSLNRTTEKMVKRRAHLTGKTNQKSLPLEWDDTYGHAFVSGIRYENRGLVIEEPGLYFVYSKVFFRGQHCSNQRLDHVVFKRNLVYSDSQVLMEDRKLNYCVSPHMWSSDSYLGALFNLAKHDSLYVNVSQFTLVNYEESRTFFGLYML